VNRLVIRKPCCFCNKEVLHKKFIEYCGKWVFLGGEAVLTASKCLSKLHIAWLKRHAFNVK
jgi:hypothetical protein